MLLLFVCLPACKATHHRCRSKRQSRNVLLGEVLQHTPQLGIEGVNSSPPSLWLCLACPYDTHSKLPSNSSKLAIKHANDSSKMQAMHDATCSGIWMHSRAPAASALQQLDGAALAPPDIELERRVGAAPLPLGAAVHGSSGPAAAQLRELHAGS